MILQCHWSALAYPRLPACEGPQSFDPTNTVLTAGAGLPERKEEGIPPTASKPIRGEVGQARRRGAPQVPSAAPAPPDDRRISSVQPTAVVCTFMGF